jgi:hypothetical protein
MTEIIAVSKQGNDALSDTNPNDFIFNSLYNSFKIVYQGKTNLSIIAGTSTYQFTHNSPLGNTSCILIFGQFPDGKATLLGALRGGQSFDRNRGLLQAYFDNTNIYINYGFVASNYTLPIVWYIFEASL